MVFNIRTEKSLKDKAESSVESRESLQISMKACERRGERKEDWTGGTLHIQFIGEQRDQRFLTLAIS